MRRNRRNHSPKLKAKRLLAENEYDLTLVGLAKQFDVYPIEIQDW